LSSEHTIKLYFFATLLALLALGFIVSEIQYSNNIPSEDEIKSLASQNVITASIAFEQFVSEFQNDNKILSSELQTLVNEGASNQDLFNKMNEDNSYWGKSLRNDSTSIVWTGFKIPLLDSLNFSDSTHTYIAITTIQNVKALTVAERFSDYEGNYYILTSSKKLQQNNILELGNDTETAISAILGLEFDLPIHFSLDDTFPDNIIYKTEQTYADRSLTASIYVTELDSEAFQRVRNVNLTKIRLVFIFSIIFVIGLLLFSLTPYLGPNKTFLISTMSIFIIWILCWLLLPFLKLELFFGAQSVQIELFYLALNTFLALAFAVFITDFYYANQEVDQKISGAIGVFILLTIGILISIVFTGISTSLYNITAQTTLNLNDLKLIPDATILVYYFFAGLLWITTSWSIFYLSIFLFKSIELNQYFLIISIALGFFFGIIFLKLFYLAPEFSWTLYLVTGLFIILIISVYLSWKNLLILKNLSRLRLFLIISLLATILAYTPFYFGQIEWRSVAMLDEAENFAQESDLEIENITIEILNKLESHLSELEIKNIQDNRSLLLSEFNDQVELLFLQNPNWQAFSFSIQLIDGKGDPISEFTSNLNAPGWTKAYDMFSLEVPFVQERIRRNRLRPIIRRNPLEQPPAKYTSFRQGWIPFFASTTSEEKLGWIIGSVYQEQPQYRKPLRAVIASKREEDKNATFLLSEYTNDKLTRISLSGLPLEIPNYPILTSETSEYLNRDSLFLESSVLAGKEVIELFWKRSANTVIKVSALEITLFNHAFSLLRFFFYLLMFVFLVSLLLQWRKSFQVLGANKRFKDQLVDRFIIASLFCLIALIATSSLAITNQSEEITISELESKLAGINSTFENNDTNDINQTLLLSSTLINSDAVLFEGNELVSSTAPQIFLQHLIPAQVPWNIYNAIINQGSDLEIQDFQLSNLEFLIGYTPIKRDGVITNIVAIPTFLKTPSFNEQLLTTISYLVGLFVIIFGIFIFAAAAIANRMTGPLEELSEGIKTISDGSLETKLPVKSNDEIGALANTFNIMVYRLQELRKDLVEAEREAAWKEMAQQVAHEIKNPLTPMKLNLQHLDLQIKTSDITLEELKTKVASINGNMIEQIESLSRIASDFSKFARPVQQEFVELDINLILKNISDLYSNDSSVSIELDLHDNPLVISGVKDELQRVFINLVKNGIEAVPKRRKGLISIKSRYENYKVVIDFEDNGEGISKENQLSIFVPNFSTKTSGTGLGLAITKKVVEEHGGEITFLSTKGKGTIFKLIFDLFVEKEDK